MLVDTDSNMKRFMMSVPDEMHAELESEMKLRRLDSIQETVRQIISAYLKDRNGPQPKIRPISNE